MKFLEKALTACFCGLLVMAILAGSCAAQQPTGSTLSGSAMKKARPSRMIQPALQPAPFKPNPLVAMLATNHRALNSAPPADLASMLSNANLPAASGKKYSMPGLAKANFLAPAKAQAWTDRDFSAPALKGTNLRPARHPGPGDFQK